jgi:hypothetical protein
VLLKVTTGNHAFPATRTSAFSRLPDYIMIRPSAERIRSRLKPVEAS